MDKVAVLIPTYNRSSLLLNCLESITKQTHHNLIIIIYDDGSTDDTRDRIRTLVQPKIQYHRSCDNRGVAYARNKLLKYAQASGAEFACWQDSDDMSSIYRIEMQLHVLKGESKACVSSRHAKLTPHNMHECFGYPQLEPSDNGRSLGSTMFRVNQALQFKDGVDYGGEDVDWVLAMKESGIAFIDLPCRLYYVRLSNTDRIGNKKLKYPDRRKKSNEARNLNLPNV